MYLRLYKFSEKFKKFAYLPIDQKDFLKYKNIFEKQFGENKANINNIINIIKNAIFHIADKQNLLPESILEIIYRRFERPQALFVSYRKQINIYDIFIDIFNAIQFSIIWFIPIENLEAYDDKSVDTSYFIDETITILELLEEEFVKIKNLFDTFQPTLELIDSEYIDLDAFVISYLEFFVKVIESYEDIFILSPNYVISKEKNTLKSIKEHYLNVIEQLKIRNQDHLLTESDEFNFRELQDLDVEYDPDNPERYQEQEGIVKEWRERKEKSKNDKEKLYYETYE